MTVENGSEFSVLDANLASVRSLENVASVTVPKDGAERCVTLMIDDPLLVDIPWISSIDTNLRQCITQSGFEPKQTTVYLDQSGELLFNNDIIEDPSSLSSMEVYFE
jgi:hypothetical protein